MEFGVAASPLGTEIAAASGLGVVCGEGEDIAAGSTAVALTREV